PRQGNRRSVFIDQRYRDTPKSQRQAMCQEYHFCIKSKAVESRSRKDFNRSGTVEDFQATLRVSYLSRVEPGHDGSEHPRGQWPPEAARRPNARILQVESPKDNVAFLPGDGVICQADPIQIVGKVGIGETDDTAGSTQHSITDGCTLA